MERNPNNNDVIACEEVLKRLRHSDGDIHILSGEPNSIELKSIIGLCDALIGTRTHATIASMKIFRYYGV